MAQIHRNIRGFTIIELLIALLMTGIITAAGFKFYVSMHNSALTQEDISNMQNMSRTSLQELTRNLRMAGYKLSGHVPYRVSGDSLFVFYSETQPCDTVLYFLQEDQNAPAVNGVKPCRLMKQVNSNPAAVFSEEIRGIQYAVVDSSTIDVTVQVQTSRSDESWASNEGYRLMTLTERVNMRNLAI